MVRAAALILSGLLLTACATANISPAGGGRSDTQLVSEQNYRLNQDMSATVGETVIRVKNYRVTTIEAPVLRANQRFEVRSGIVRGWVNQGDRLRIVGRRQINGVDHTLVLALPSEDLALQIAPDGTIFNHALIVGMNVQVLPALTLNPPSPTFTPVIVTRSSALPGDENYEIIFTGVDPNAMHFQYREYAGDDLVRPAFSQELSYPANSTTIRHRRLVIEVTGVRDSLLHYRVASDR